MHERNWQERNGRRRNRRLLAGAALGALAAFVPMAANAQAASSVSRPVVQAVPGAGSARLNAALARLARDARDVSALIEAGDAARAMGDFDAAIGFYRRADEVQPENPRIKAGLGSAFVMNGDPVSALPHFADADRLGATPALIGADRGLAYDLVGDNAAAQRQYQTALLDTTGAASDTVRMRLAVSQAITGSLSTSQTTLMPLLSKQDKPGWRTRAFTLAIAGETSEAVITAEKILPPQLAQGIAPYLRYMPRLTRAQQAAAANLGRFPRASEIGRDDSRIAAYAPPRLAAADTALIPKGAPLDAVKPGSVAKPRGRKERAASLPTTGGTGTTSSARVPALAARTARSAAADTARVAPPEPKPAIEQNGELPPIGRGASSSAVAPSLAAAKTPALAAGPGAGVASASTIGARPSVALAGKPASTLDTPATPTTTSTSTTPGAAASKLPLAGTGAGGAAQGNFNLSSVSARSGAAPAAAPERVKAPSSSALAPSLAPSLAPPLARAPSPAATPTASPPAPTAAPPASQPAGLASTSGAVPAPSASSATGGGPARLVSLSEIFADLGAPTTEAAPAAGAVDLRTLPPPRPVAKIEPKPEAKPEAKVVLSDVSTARASAKGTPAEEAAAKGASAKGAASAKVAGAKALADAKGKKDAKALADEKAKAKKPAPPVHPSRIWVQIGVGRDKAAIAFDWRRYGKQAPALFKGRTAYISEMGRTNRILAGPFDTAKAASAFAADLKKAGFDGVLPWTSSAGQVVDPLDAR